MLACMRRASVLLIGVLLGSGCASTLPPPPRPTIRDATSEEREAIGRLLVPLLITSGIWTGRADGCAAALAHEIGHVQLGHFTARKERRAAEKKARDEIQDKATTAGAVVTAIPIIGPILAIGVAGTQAATDTRVEVEYRAYDREDEHAADRFGHDLLELVIGRVRACQAEVALLDRLMQARSSRPWSDWLSTHPRPSDRLKDVRELCPA